MSTIYSFLQKIKMRESHHGFLMILTAYLLSVFMLALGSDTFYKINSAAAGIGTDTKEETKEPEAGYIYRTYDAEPTPELVKSLLINPYGLKDTEDVGQVEGTSAIMSISGDTIWMFGNAMDGAVFDNMMEQPVSFQSSTKTVKADTEKAEDKEETAKSKETTSPYIINVTKDEIKMLERIVEAEASGEDIEGKILIANVVFNRISDDDFPDTVKGVIFQKSEGKYQFSPVADERYWSVKISDDTKDAVIRALKGEDYSKGALYFIARKRTKSSSARWFDNNLKWLFKHGGHEFYK
jgi:N-acetylmuramoyl-L-alanine amidase